MNGLIIKDFRLLKGQLNFFVVFIIIGAAISWFSDDPEFAIGYIGLIGSFFTLSTVSYDEFNNGYAFMFCLPISRKIYVAEKYIFGIILCICSILAGFLPTLLISTIKGGFNTTDCLYTVGSIFAMVMVLISFMIPIQLHFGSEKSRLALLIPFGVVLVCGLILKVIFNAISFDIMPLITAIAETSSNIVIPIIIAIVLLSITFSYKISLLLMRKKEF